jgi:ketosteroid isomerase-like protein
MMAEVSSARRDTLKLLAAGALAATMAGPARAAAAVQVSPVEQAVRAAFASPDPAARLALLLDDAIVIDHDVPFPLDKAEYRDHAEFEAQAWERVETLFSQSQVAMHGDTAIFSAYFIQRGKPKNAGFRLRAGYCTAVCARTPDGWRVLGLHMSPLSSQIIDASPS